MKIGLIGGPGMINSPMMNYIMQSDSDADKIINTNDGFNSLSETETDALM